MSKIDFQILKKIAEQTHVSEEDILFSLEDAINQAYDKRNGNDDFEMSDERRKELQRRRIVEIDRETGEISVYFAKDVVEEVTDSETQISLEDARREDPEFQIGDSYEIDKTPADFQDLGRVMAHQTKSVFTQKVTEKQRNHIMEAYKGKEGEIVNCTVETFEENEIVDQRTGNVRKKKRVICRVDETVEGVIEDEDRLPMDNFKEGEKIKAYLVKVADRKERSRKRGDRKQSDAMKEPVLKLSRTNNGFLRKLLETQVPEIELGVVEVKGIARNPGQRAKVSVVSHNVNVDPISACVGEKGNRINLIMEELGGEKIDIIRWSPDLVEYVESALSPAKCRDNGTAVVFEEQIENRDGKLKNRQVVSLSVPDDQLTLAIGNRGINVTLAAKLCNCRIDIKGNNSEDSESASAREELEKAFR